MEIVIVNSIDRLPDVLLSSYMIALVKIGDKRNAGVVPTLSSDSVDTRLLDLVGKRKGVCTLSWLREGVRTTDNESVQVTGHRYQMILLSEYTQNRDDLIDLAASAGIDQRLIVLVKGNMLISFTSLYH